MTIYVESVELTQEQNDELKSFKDAGITDNVYGFLYEVMQGSLPSLSGMAEDNRDELAKAWLFPEIIEVIE